MRQDRRHAVRRHAVRRHCSRATLQQNEFVARRTCSRLNLQGSGAARRTFSRPKLPQNQLAAGRHCSRATLQQGDTSAERICRLPERPEVDSARRQSGGRQSVGRQSGLRRQAAGCPAPSRSAARGPCQNFCIDVCVCVLLLF